MAQIIPRFDLGSELGKALGTGLGSGLQNLANLKLKEIQQRQQSGRLEEAGLPGVLAHLDPQVQAQYMRGAQAAQIDAQKQQQESQLQGLLEEALSGKSLPTEQLENLTLRDEETATKVDSVAPPKAGKEPVKLKTPESQLSDQISNIEKRINDPKLSATQKKQLREHKEKLEDRLEKRVEKIDKSTNEFFKQTMKEGRTAKQNNKRLDRMETLIERGNLSIPVYAAGLDALAKGIFGVGIDLTSLSSADSQEFRKLSNDFIREAKSIFGARLTDADLRAFMKMIPTLSQSSAGKQAVIANMRNFNAATEARQAAMEEIIEQNRGIRPKNLEALVEKRISPKLDELASQFALRP